jgi:hypothetical protein
MPDLRMPDLSGRTLMAIVVVMAGIVAMLVALLSSASSPTSDNPRQSGKQSAIEPVVPIDPEDAGQRPDTKEKRIDPKDPFATGFGKSARREVTIRVTGNGTVYVATFYRDKEEPSRRRVSGAYSTTRTFKGKFPMASVVARLPGNIPGAASRATCAITIDGVEVASQTTKDGDLAICVG